MLYALLKTTNSQDEWTRVSEAGPNPFEWWDVTYIDLPQDVSQSRAMTRLADAATTFANAAASAVQLLEKYLDFKMK